ncbi:glutamate receptor 2.8 [Amborella trichopoda]|nr:glutamate receptor 2.8 [Amborella trichopoda]|eukprot:XP_011623930.2 glutamate receptor 2.8 [Amborella trichopoda]
MRIHFKMKSSEVALLLLLLLHLLQFHRAEAQAKKRAEEVNVGVVIGLRSMVGKSMRIGIEMALQDFYTVHPNHTTRLILHWRDSKLDVVEAALAAMDLVNNTGVKAILGPQTSAEAEFLSDLGKNSQIPILSPSATSPSLSSIHTPYFIRATLSDSTQAKAIASLSLAYNWRQAVAIYEDTEYGAGFIPYLTDALQERGSRLQDRAIISSSSSDEYIGEELYRLMTMQTRVFIVHITSPVASRLFRKAQKIGMMSKGYAWIITDGLASLLSSLNPLVLATMRGVIGVKPYVPESKGLADLSARWKPRYKMEFKNEAHNKIPEVNIFGLRAYDAAWALAQSVETLGNLSENKLSAPRAFPAGLELLNAILRTKFSGLSGDFRLINGELQASTFQIVNVAEKLSGKLDAEVIGYWSPDHGLSKNLTVHMAERYSIHADDLRPLIWPGESTVVPKGWVVPTNGKKLRIGVPVKPGFTEFVKVERNPLDNRVTVMGFSKDVFTAVLDALPYALPYEFVPFGEPNGENFTYDELLYQVYNEKYDAVMGDTTIIANRSKYVDFTLPYTDSGVVLVVPKMPEESKNAWVFLKPLTWEMWMTSAIFFVLTGFVVWVLEHPENRDFRGPLWHQVGVVFWFAFSTMVFSHKEKVVSNLGRLVVIIWLFVVLILTSSYTASLTSLLTVQRLKPTVTDLNTLIERGEYIGFQFGSFVPELLMHMTSKDVKLRRYNSPQEYADALSKGSKNGGVGGIVDEIPYIKLFLSRYCEQYTMVGPTYPTAGFGFAFPRSSPLLPDISRAILNVTEGDQMSRIEAAWLGAQTTCSDSSTTLSSESLDVNSFQGLFQITGLASTLALTISLILFVFDYCKRPRRENVPTQRRLLHRMVSMVRYFDEKVPSPHVLER